MISRYDKKEISSIWDDHSKFSTYLEVELAILKSLEGEMIPEGTSDKIRSQAKIDPDRINEIEQKTRHDVIAFCTSITENLDAETGKYFHFGVTSSDIIDSATVLQIKKSLDVILPAYEELLRTLKDRAMEMKEVITIGRSHGMYAEPMSFGQKLLGHYNEFARRYAELKDFYLHELTVQFSGAVGNYTILSPENEKKAAETLGLLVEPVSTQVIPRDRIAKLININGLIGAAIERICVEIRHLHRSDVGELHEGFKKGQKGSSTMPHKKNPISGENLTGMARMLRSHTTIASENIVLWHERDISHSSAERFMLPDNFGILYYSITRLKDTIRDLVFHNEKIEARVMEGHTYLSSYYLHHLIEKTDIKREDLYYFVQEAAFAGSEASSAEVFHETLVQTMKDKGHEIDLPKPTFAEIKKIYTKHVDSVFSRSFEQYPTP
ncbi:MAG: adenylosuccinate lyase [Halobacteriovoraceae bacterium]|nr:adenylosuccinate lyase [Halobacteriovoraceae bacterium]MBC96621.1 adenylosuccinate lyase [Halobacteriovoraceae bacterium]|tara:strand:- start:55202 stop:56518 length:1317 start_codon:yes stop_codon:yes gene_type:complete